MAFAIASASVLLAVMLLHVFDPFNLVISSEVATLPASSTAAIVVRPVVTDLTISFSSSSGQHLPSGLDPRQWHRVEKDLYLYTSRQSAWLYVALMDEQELGAEDMMVVDIRVGKQPPNPGSANTWESRPGGIWILRTKFSGNIGQAVTHVDVLFGPDAIDPRPQWKLIRSPLQIQTPRDAHVASLTILHGRAEPPPDAKAGLRVREDGKFKIIQISDTHMVTGTGICKDAIDAHGNHLPENKADPLTVKFIEEVLDIEGPDLVVLTGDQLHHDIPDTQSALFKVVAPMIARSIPFAAVFGNHDSEGRNALSRTAQMSILQNLPFSLCEPGPEHVDGIGNYYIEILAHSPVQIPLATLYFLDSHGQVPKSIYGSNYEPIKQSQIDWFLDTTNEHGSRRGKGSSNGNFHLSIVYQHIPLPEFGCSNLDIRGGNRREPTEAPRRNSHFYNALVQSGISALGCGHDHVNDFCALLPFKRQQNRSKTLTRPWLCHAGGSGFGGYSSAC
ncbi:Metallo-dependent phosphatase [Pseudovirgaria hyperparasitica]|uniref:Metallo-dependent phosphatase n=1 Tax=Pseudovirgaria hyperparasitica TaxID=470096 RepID=A0A6A6VS44_9PEZI|nr:Metallo-dependent phosphatase [Pseudovirgaria hyperparasitica]KAF2752410.1 Metallo-dependent phosphatase [Pseudovirgaria hyperparasitica]